MHRVFMVLLLGAGCAGAAEESAPSEPAYVLGSAGDEVVDGDTTGDAPTTPEERAALEARTQSSRMDAQARRAAAEVEHQARCANVILSPGLPPAPPPAPSTPALDALQTSYEASLAAPLTRPQDSSMAGVNQWAQTVFAQWVRLYGTRLRALYQAVTSTPESDRQYALAWAAHAYAVFVERFHDTPIPDEIAQDAELRSSFVGALSAQTVSLQQRAKELLDDVVLPGAWAQWKVTMEAWLGQEACAFR